MSNEMAFMFKMLSASISHLDLLENHYWCNLMELLSPPIVKEWEGL